METARPVDGEDSVLSLQVTTLTERAAQAGHRLPLLRLKKPLLPMCISGLRRISLAPKATEVRGFLLPPL